MPTIKTLYAPGTLIRIRERDWVVLLKEDDNVLRIRPVDGSDEDAVGLFLPFEGQDISESQYAPPDGSNPGDLTGALALKDAVRLTLRNGAGPFRSMGRISVSPRPYQLVPLIVALRLNPVRMLVADDVGVGKTIEVAMIAREFLDRGLIKRIGVICPPHLCEQWSKELFEKFNIQTAIVQPSRIARLEREIPRSDISLYNYYRHLVVSIDYIKSDKNKRFFLDNAPDFIIIDEAHTAARPRGNTYSNIQKRYAFLRELAENGNRHLLLVTATPHSGVEESFRSLLGLLNRSFDTPPESDLDYRALLPHVIQRKRKELENWLGKTEFPDRLPPVEMPYQLTREYYRLFEDILNYCRETVSGGANETAVRQRVRYWAAIAILRCVLSSPAAAESMLESRRDRSKQHKQTDSEVAVGEISEELSSQLFDNEESDEPADYIPNTPTLTREDITKLNSFLNAAQRLGNPQADNKLAVTIDAVRELLRDNFHPIVYCRFIASAKYVAEHLQESLHKEFPGLNVRAVTGGDGDSEQRAENVADLAKSPVRVLVATECLSEGINLQDSFDAVVHYDLPWNPNRLEQREGRVDRFGQKRTQIKIITISGSNNPIDQAVLNVLIRKAQTIRKSTGVSVPVPVASEQVMEAIIGNVLLRPAGPGQQLQLGIEDPRVSKLHQEWDEAAERDKKLYSFFSQHKIQPSEVARELSEMEPVLGTSKDVQSFVANTIQRFNGKLVPVARQADVFTFYPGDLATTVSGRLPNVSFPVKVTFADVPPDGVIRLGRNHPIVVTLSDAVIAEALHRNNPLFARCGAVFTNVVAMRTAVLILRCRYQLIEATEQFAEEVVTAAFQRSANDNLQWLQPLQETGLNLLKTVTPAANMPLEDKKAHVRWALDMLKGNWFDSIVSERAHILEEAHSRLRKAVRTSPLKVVPHTPPDILGCYVLVPAGGGK
jgi:superfamily II DNA or RNA helicase